MKRDFDRIVIENFSELEELIKIVKDKKDSEISRKLYEILDEMKDDYLDSLNRKF
jgi:hypothetical protein